MTIKQALAIGKGESLNLNLEYQDSDGNAINLTGHNVDLIVKKTGSGTVVGTYAADVDTVGNIAIVVADEITDTWPVGKSGYVVVHEDPDGNKHWLMYGPLTVKDIADV